MPTMGLLPTAATPEGAGVRRLLVLRPGAIGDTLVTVPALLRPASTVPVRADRGGRQPRRPAAPGVQRAGGSLHPVRRSARHAAVHGGGARARRSVPRARRGGRLVRRSGRRARAGASGARRLPGGRDPVEAAARAADPRRALPARNARAARRGARRPARSAADSDLHGRRAPGCARRSLALGLEGRPFVAIHPGSGSPAKNWPAERFAEVVGGAGEGSRAAVADPRRPRRRRGAGASPGRDAHPRPASCSTGRSRSWRPSCGGRAAFLGNDSGLAHLAGLLGVPTLALFGPTDPVHWSPLGPTVRTLRSEPLADLPPTASSPSCRCCWPTQPDSVMSSGSAARARRSASRALVLDLVALVGRLVERPLDAVGQIALADPVPVVVVRIQVRRARSPCRAPRRTRRCAGGAAPRWTRPRRWPPWPRRSPSAPRSTSAPSPGRASPGSGSAPPPASRPARPPGPPTAPPPARSGRRCRCPRRPGSPAGVR